MIKGSPLSLQQVFQRRFDGTESFDRTWLEYEEGFGSAAGEFWLGNCLYIFLKNLSYKVADKKNERALLSETLKKIKTEIRYVK